MARNVWQDQALLEFRAMRKFYAANVRFKTDSTMYVQTIFRRPDQLESTVTSHVGSNLIRSRVFDKILEAENETRARKDKQQVDIVLVEGTGLGTMHQQDHASRMSADDGDHQH